MGKHSTDYDKTLCYNNMVLLYYYSLSDYQNAWHYLQKMGDDKIKAQSMEFETAHGAQKLVPKIDKKVAIKYYKMFLRKHKLNGSVERAQIIDNIYNNISILLSDDEHFCQKMEKFKQSGDKNEELRLFVEWIHDQ